MKKFIIFALVAFTSVMSFAQEKMKVVLNDGSTSEFEVKKIKQVYFEGQDITLTTGTASSITQNSVEISYTVDGVNGSISGGVVLSTSSYLDYDNCQHVSMVSSRNGQNSVSITGLNASTTYYYRAFAMSGKDFYYGEIRSFRTLDPVSTVLYHEPYTVWGSSLTQTKNNMSGYSIYKETTDQLVYYGKDKETLIMYSFENSKLVTAQVVIKTSNATQTEIDSKLKENGYTYVGTSNETLMYISSDYLTGVFVELNTEVSAYSITYFDYKWLQNQNQTSTLFGEPYTNWGAFRSTVKSAVSNLGYTLQGESTQASDYYYLAYKGKYKEIYTMYMFDESMKLNMVNIIFESSAVSLDDARNYLSSELSYNYVGTNTAKTQYYYLTKDNKSYAVVRSLTLSSGEVMTYITYISYDSMSSRQKTRGNFENEEQFDNVNFPDLPDMKYDKQDLLRNKLQNLVNNNMMKWPKISLNK